MARSTYLSQNVTQDQLDLLLLLDENELDIFSLDDLKKIVITMAKEAKKAGVQIVTGSTRTVRTCADGIHAFVSGSNIQGAIRAKHGR